MQECPLYVWAPPYVWMPNVCLDIPHMFGHLPYVWMPLVCLDDVWMPAVHIQHKESTLCQTEGVSICTPYIWMPLYVWTPPICLDGSQTYGCPHTIHLAASKHTGAAKHMEGI